MHIILLSIFNKLSLASNLWNKLYTIGTNKIIQTIFCQIADTYSLKKTQPYSEEQVVG